MDGVRQLLRPLVSGLTYQRWVHLLLGGVLLVPYAGLAALFATASQTGTDVLGLIVLAAVAVVGAVLIALIPAVRVLELAAARALLGVALPDPDPEELRSWPARRRSAVWYLANLLVGGLAALATLTVLPTTVGLAQVPFVALRPLELGGLQWDAPVGWAAAWIPMAGLALLVGLVYFVAAAGALLARWAPRVLGPTPAARLLALRREADALAARNRLARELHDSVGHALTVTTLQAGAARGVLDSDPEFARRALAAIEDTGRTALDQLDYVLGLLRSADGGERQEDRRAPVPDMVDLDALLDAARTAGTAVSAELAGPVREVPVAVSREAYRIVQEGLTNALRHAEGAPVTVRLAADANELTVELTNAVQAGATPGRTGGRGLRGMRERVEVLRGAMTAGADGGLWRIAVRLPIGGSR